VVLHKITDDLERSVVFLFILLDGILRKQGFQNVCTFLPD